MEKKREDFGFGKGREGQQDLEICKLNLIWVLVLGRGGDEVGELVSKKSCSSKVERMPKVTHLMIMLPLNFEPPPMLRSR